MEENEYRSSYNKLVDYPCVFAKAINSTSCTCQQARKIQIADRIALNCSAAHYHQQCNALIEKLRTAAQFVLHMPDIAGTLSHNKEIQVQIGGIKGIAMMLNDHKDVDKPDIHEIHTQAIDTFGNLDKLPYSEIVRYILQSKRRKRRARKNDEND